MLIALNSVEYIPLISFQFWHKSARALSNGIVLDRQEVVALRQGELSPCYISENIGDFNGHVLEGKLISRGWVLQEDALGRRTVYFTGQQTYFECGEGVRCETMTTMRK